MLFFNSTSSSSILLFTYMFIYNVSLVSLFWLLFSVVLTQFKTLHSFNKLTFSSFHVAAVTILLFSMAGVPPFIGFFSKLFILTILSNNSFALLYALFFVVLFFGLYFYVQNIRFLHSTNGGSIPQQNFNGIERQSVLLYYTTNYTLFMVILGVIYVEDVLLLFTWLLN